MDAEAKALQERLHQANEKRWDGVERNIGELKTEVREIRPEHALFLAARYELRRSR